MALPWSTVDLSKTLECLMKLDSLVKCSNCHEIPPLGENGVRLVKTGICGHSVCSGIGCSKISGGGDSGDKTQCPAVGCKAFIRDFVEDKEEANRIDAIQGLKNILVPQNESDTPKPSSSDNESKEWGFMMPTQEAPTKNLVNTGRSKRTRKVLRANNYILSGDETDESYVPDKENIKNGKRKKTPQAKKSDQCKGENKRNISLNKKNKRGETALHCACIKVRSSDKFFQNQNPST